MVEVRTMRTLTIILALAAVTALLVAGPVAAHDVDGNEHSHEEGLYHGWSTLPLVGLTVFVYWGLAIPIALLIYTDANERRLKGTKWAYLLLVPFLGLFALLAYPRAIKGHPRTDIHDPWADGDLISESRKSLAECPPDSG
jgi:hypothetical protein